MKRVDIILLSFSFVRFAIPFFIAGEDLSSLTVGSGMKRIASRDRLKQLVSLSGHHTSNHSLVPVDQPPQPGVIGRFTVLTDVGSLGSSPGSVDRMRRVSSSSSIASQGES